MKNEKTPARAAQYQTRIVNPVSTRTETPPPQAPATPPAPAPEPQPAAAEPLPKPPRGYLPVVDYRATICPNCGSAKSHVYRSERMSDEVIRRLHSCPCSATFASMQTVPMVDRESFAAERAARAGKPQEMTAKA